MKRVLLGLGLLLVLIIGCWFYVLHHVDPVDVARETGDGESEWRPASPADTPDSRPAVARRTGKRRPVVMRRDVEPDEEEDEDELSPAERALSDRIERALDEEDFALAHACVAEARSCPAVDVRQSMVDTLAWFGARAIPDLTLFVADNDEDVAESARNEWEMAISEVTDDADRIAMVGLTMTVVADEDFLESISGEYIGIDEKLAVESLLGVIETPGATPEGVAKARETYEFVTGEEFVSRDEAERWLKEEYEPPEAENVTENEDAA